MTKTPCSVRVCERNAVMPLVCKTPYGESGPMWFCKECGHLALLRNEWRESPAYLGGQGRSARSVREDGSAIFFTILACALVVAGLIVGGKLWPR